MQKDALTFASEANPHRSPDRLTTLALLAPAGWLVAFASLILHARLVAGEWPHGRTGNFFDGTMRPESSSSELLDLHSNLVFVSALLLLWIIALGLLFLGASIFAKRLRQPPWLVAMFMTASTLAAVILFLDPGGFMVWLAD